MEAPKNKNEILDLFKQRPAMLQNALSDLDDNEPDYIPADGGWTIRQIVHHLADGDDIWITIIKAAQGGEQPEFNLEWYQKTPQAEWAKRWNYEKRPFDISLNLFKTNREHILQLLEYTPDSWTKNYATGKRMEQLNRYPLVL